jgi:hypothetical protein
VSRHAYNITKAKLALEIIFGLRAYAPTGNSSQTSYQTHNAMPFQLVSSTSPTGIVQATPVSPQPTGYVNETKQVKQYIVQDEELGNGAEVARELLRLTEDPIKYFRHHRITAPWLDWMDAFEPDVRRRWFKRPKRVKFGTRVTSDKSERQRYAMERVFSHNKHEGPGYRMRDGYNRVHRWPKDERYIGSYDGALKELVIQCTDDIFYTENNAPWTRARIKDLSPYSLRVANWCAWNVQHHGISQERRIMRQIVGSCLLFLPVRPDPPIFALSASLT